MDLVRYYGTTQVTTDICTGNFPGRLVPGNLLGSWSCNKVRGNLQCTWALVISLIHGILPGIWSGTHVPGNLPSANALVGIRSRRIQQIWIVEHVKPNAQIEIFSTIVEIEPCFTSGYLFIILWNVGRSNQWIPQKHIKICFKISIFLMFAQVKGR